MSEQLGLITAQMEPLQAKATQLQKNNILTIYKKEFPKRVFIQIAILS